MTTSIVLQEKLETFGDIRRMLLDTVLSLRDGNIDVPYAMAIAAVMKEVNNNIQQEINATKLAMVVNNEINDFGKIVRMGTRKINGDEDK